MLGTGYLEAPGGGGAPGEQHFMLCSRWMGKGGGGLCWVASLLFSRAAPCQYNNVYWGRNIFACGPIISSCVISINEMVFSLMRKRNKVRCVLVNRKTN